MSAAKFTAASVSLTVLVTLCSQPADAALTISVKATKGVTCAKGVCTGKSKNSTLNASDLANLLAAGPLTVDSGNKAQDIVVAAGFGWGSGNGLILKADRSISVDKTVSIAGEGGLELFTNQSGGNDGQLTFGPSGNITFMSTSSFLSINNIPYAVVNSVATLAQSVAAAPHGNYALGVSYDASNDGTYTSAPVAIQLLGTFEGLGNSISNLTVNDPAGSDLVGLFAQVGGDTGNLGAIRDFALLKSSISGGDGAGVGGLTGLLTQGAVVEHSSVSGSIKAGSGAAAGGIAGNNIGSMIDGTSSNASVAVGTGGAQAGGIAGFSNGTITGAKATGPISGGPGDYVGGLVAQNQGAIATSFSTGKVTGGGNGSDVGGLVAVNQGPVGNSYATGSVNNSGGGAASNVGGLLGYNQAAVGDSYSSGKIKADKSDSVGGVVGFDNGTANFTDTYWDKTSSGVKKTSQGAGNIKNDPGLSGLSDAQLQAALPAGFSTDVWAQTAKLNGGLPYLTSNPPEK